MKNLSLKNLKFHEDMSEETPCFSADLYEDGKLVAHVKNDGRGGGNSVTPANGLSWKDVQRFDNLDTECHIFGLAEELNIVNKKQSNCLVLKKDGNIYLQKYKGTLAQIKKTNPTTFISWIKNEVEKANKEGYEVLNTNFKL